jgi:hypothetical protein
MQYNKLSKTELAWVRWHRRRNSIVCQLMHNDKDLTVEEARKMARNKMPPPPDKRSKRKKNKKTK